MWLHYALPGWGQREYFQTDKKQRIRGWAYHVIYAASLFLIQDSYSKYTSSQAQFNKVKKDYEGHDEGTSQTTFDDDYALMEMYRDDYINYKNNYYGGIGIISLMYTINLFEISILQGR